MHRYLYNYLCLIVEKNLHANTTSKSQILQMLIYTQKYSHQYNNGNKGEFFEENGEESKYLTLEVFTRYVI